MPQRSSKSKEDSLPSQGTFIRPTPSEYYTYRIQRGEQGVLTHEPYKSYLLPLWRFRTPSIAEKSSTALFDEFLRFYKEDDFVGMDMSRKFIQMGMTRSKRYANHKGGRKYDIGQNGEKVEKDKSRGHEGQEDKLIASGIFKEMWERCRKHEGYNVLKERYQKELKDWIRGHSKDQSQEEEEDRVEGQDQSKELKHIKQEKGEEEEMGIIPRKKPQAKNREDGHRKPRKKLKTTNP